MDHDRTRFYRVGFDSAMIALGLLIRGPRVRSPPGSPVFASLSKHRATALPSIAGASGHAQICMTMNAGNHAPAWRVNFISPRPGRKIAGPNVQEGLTRHFHVASALNR